MSESESVSLTLNDSYSYISYEDNAVVSSIVQSWIGLEFQQKILAILLFWLCVNLILIRIAWRAYGHRLTEVLTKGLYFVSVLFYFRKSLLTFVLVFLGGGWGCCRFTLSISFSISLAFHDHFMAV